MSDKSARDETQGASGKSSKSGVEKLLSINKKPGQKSSRSENFRRALKGAFGSSYQKEVEKEVQRRVKGPQMNTELRNHFEKY